MIQLLGGGWRGGVMSCQLSSVKCCCLHLSPDPASSGVCGLISHLQILTAVIPDRSYFPVLISSWTSRFRRLCFQRFGSPAPPLALQDIEPHAKRQRSCPSAYVPFTSSKSYFSFLTPPFPPSSSPFLFSDGPHVPPSLVILSPWTPGAGGGRKSRTPAPPSPPTPPGRRLTSALTSRPSAPTKPRLPWTEAAIRSGSRRLGLRSKRPPECEPGCLYGGRRLSLEMMSKYTSS